MVGKLKAIIIEVSGGNVRNHHLNLRGAFGFFPTDALGGSNADAAGQTIKLTIGSSDVETDIDEGKAIFRERSAIRRFFEDESIVENDLVMIEKLGARHYQLSKISKRGFKIYF